MKIAICDDDKTEQLQILELLEEYFKEGKTNQPSKPSVAALNLLPSPATNSLTSIFLMLLCLY